MATVSIPGTCVTQKMTAATTPTNDSAVSAFCPQDKYICTYALELRSIHTERELPLDLPLVARLGKEYIHFQGTIDTIVMPLEMLLANGSILISQAAIASGNCQLATLSPRSELGLKWSDQLKRILCGR